MNATVGNEWRSATMAAPMFGVKGRDRRLLRQLFRFATVLAVSVFLAACGGADKPPKGVVDHIQQYFGGVAADEPHAVLVARDVLSAGGTAADAAVALYFTLSVTLPSSAGLGGGGACVVHGAGKPTAEVLDFSARVPSSAAEKGRWAAAVPGAVRGMFALHARYGALQWRNLVRHGERLARFGVPASRAFARQLAGGIERLRQDPESWRLFAGARNAGVAEGEMLRQLDLAAVLGRIRIKGAGDFYSGETARKIVAGVRAAGGHLTREDLRAYHPRWIPALKAPYGNNILYFPGPPVSGGTIAHALWTTLGNGKLYESAKGPERQRVLAQAAAKVYPNIDLRIANNFGTTGFVVMDNKGGAVACSLSMYGLFGNGRLIRNTGILAAPSPARSAAAALAPMVMINIHTNDAFMAAAASAKAAAPATLVSTVLAALQKGVSLESALATARVRPGTHAGTALVEPAASAEVRAALTGAGLKIEQSGAMGRVNIMYCPDGMVRTPELCDVQTDRRGFGYAINAEF